jgi:hypothetical protein
VNIQISLIAKPGNSARNRRSGRMRLTPGRHLKPTAPQEAIGSHDRFIKSHRESESALWGIHKPMEVEMSVIHLKRSERDERYIGTFFELEPMIRDLRRFIELVAEKLGDATSAHAHPSDLEFAEFLAYRAHDEVHKLKKAFDSAFQRERS